MIEAIVDSNGILMGARCNGEDITHLILAGASLTTTEMGSKLNMTVTCTVKTVGVDY